MQVDFISNILNPLIEAVKNSPYIVYIKDEHDNFIYFNETVEKLLCVNLDSDHEPGSKEKEIYDNLFANDVHLLEGETLACSSRVYFLGGDDKNQNSTSPLNNPRCFHFTKCPIIAEDEAQTRYILGFGIEITNWLVEEKTLNFFKKIIDSMTDAVILTDVDYPYAVRYVNRAFEKNTGYAFSEVKGKSPTEVLGKLDSGIEKLRRDEFNSKLKQRRICDVVLTNYKKDGTPYASHIKVIPLFHSNNETPDYFIGIQRDITEKLVLEAGSKRKSAKLNALFNGTSNYLWLLDKSGVIDEMNLAARIAGKYIEKTTTLQLRFDQGRWWKANAESQIVATNFIDKVLATGKKQHLNVEFLNSVDEVLYVRLVGTPFRTSEGEIDYVVVEATDITEVQKEKQKAESIARGVIETHRVLKEENADEVVRQWQKSELDGESLERVVRMETTLFESMQPKVERLDAAVHDPETGLVVRLQDMSEVVNSIDKKLDKSESFFATMAVVGKVPRFLRRPVVKWFLLIVLGAGTVNVLESTGSRIFELFRFVGNEVEDVQEQQMQEQEIIEPSEPTSDVVP